MIGIIYYARYSSDSQREESIDGQLRECKAYAEKNGITFKFKDGTETITFAAFEKSALDSGFKGIGCIKK